MDQVIEASAELQDIYFRRILIYSVTRVVPTVSNRKGLEGVSDKNQKLMLSYFKRLEGLTTEFAARC